MNGVDKGLVPVVSRVLCKIPPERARLPPPLRARWKDDPVTAYVREARHRSRAAADFPEDALDSVGRAHALPVAVRHAVEREQRFPIP